MKKLELKSFAGPQILTGLDRFTCKRAPFKDTDKVECEVVRFTINGRSYEVYENPNDGYRSLHVGPKRTRAKIKNTFAGVVLLGVHRVGRDEDDIIEFISVVTGKPVLRLGTSHHDCYYPSFISDFSAEELDRAAKHLTFEMSPPKRLLQGDTEGAAQ